MVKLNVRIAHEFASWLLVRSWVPYEQISCLYKAQKNNIIWWYTKSDIRYSLAKCLVLNKQTMAKKLGMLFYAAMYVCPIIINITEISKNIRVISEFFVG